MRILTNWIGTVAILLTLVIGTLSWPTTKRYRCFENQFDLTEICLISDVLCTDGENLIYLTEDHTLDSSRVKSGTDSINIFSTFLETIPPKKAGEESGIPRYSGWIAYWKSWRSIHETQTNITWIEGGTYLAKYRSIVESTNIYHWWQHINYMLTAIVSNKTHGYPFPPIEKIILLSEKKETNWGTWQENV